MTSKFRFDPLAKSLCRYAKAVVLTGATGPKIREALLACPDYTEGNPAVVSEPNFGRAVENQRAAPPVQATILIYSFPRLCRF